MADIITAFWLSSLLYFNEGAATDGQSPLKDNPDLVVTGLFTGLGFVIGSVRSHVASDSAFDKMLWPERYYQTKSIMKLTMIGLTGSMLGPFQTAAIRVKNGFRDNGLFRGSQEGDMLGTAFFEDSEARYKAFVKRGKNIEIKIAEDARNNFLGTVTKLLRRNRPQNSSKDEEKTTAKTKGYANRRVYRLTLTDDSVPHVSQDTELVEVISLKPSIATMLLGIAVSESTALLTGCVVAAIWRSGFAIVWFLPLLLRMLALRFRLRRTPLKTTKTTNPSENTGFRSTACVFEPDDHKNGFVLIAAPAACGTQFFRHFGHPLRSDLPSDRWNERVSMSVAIAVGLFFPASWVAFAFAPNNVRLAWICYQLFNFVIMLIVQDFGLLEVGSLEDQVACALHAQKIVRLGDDDTGHVLISLKEFGTGSIAEAREIVEATKAEILEQ